jgi:hypothetical protein
MYCFHKALANTLNNIGGVRKHAYIIYHKSDEVYLSYLEK